MPMPVERWITVGTLKDGSEHTDDTTLQGRGQSKGCAEHIAGTQNARGANLRVVREVWNGPGVRWDREKGTE